LAKTNRNAIIAAISCQILIMTAKNAIGLFVPFVLRHYSIFNLNQLERIDIMPTVEVQCYTCGEYFKVDASTEEIELGCVFSRCPACNNEQENLITDEYN
jgi:Zn finger protein HypA/HybF involved in hydrogenase expression